MFDDLNVPQKLAGNSVYWLFSREPEDRGTGRSVLLAKVLLELARQNEGEWVKAITHDCPIPGRDGHFRAEMMFDLIKNLAKIDEDAFGEFEFGPRRDLLFRYKLLGG